VRRLAAVAAHCLLQLTALSTAIGAPVQDTRLQLAIPGIESTIQKSGAEVAVAFQTLDGRTQWLRRADESFHVRRDPSCW
jgi:hypothetical protein